MHLSDGLQTPTTSPGKWDQIIDDVFDRLYAEWESRGDKATSDALLSGGKEHPPANLDSGIPADKKISTGNQMWPQYPRSLVPPSKACKIIEESEAVNKSVVAQAMLKNSNMERPPAVLWSREALNNMTESESHGIRLGKPKHHAPACPDGSSEMEGGMRL